MTYQQTYFASLSALQHSLAARVAHDLQKAIAERGQAVMVVSGGKSPKAFFEMLAQMPLDWGVVHILLADERIATAEPLQTNAHVVQEYLLQGYAKMAQFWPLWNGKASPELTLANTITLLGRFSDVYDVVVLGMGEDGHTASLFPDADNIVEALADSAVDAVLIRPKNAPFLRISQTRQRLIRARALYLPVFGAAKIPVLRAAQNAIDESYPISRFLHTPGLHLSILCYEGSE